MTESLIVLLVIAAGLYFVLRGLFRKRPRKRRQRRPPEPVQDAGRAVLKARPHLVGKAYVTDGDGIRVSGQEVRFSSLDAPEFDQVAKHRDGYWFGHGKRVKSALIREIGGRQVHVTVENYDKFGRAVGIVTCNGKDVGEWLVREGHAIAAYSDRYKHLEREARQAKRGMWGHAVNIDPRRWRHRSTSRS